MDETPDRSQRFAHESTLKPGLQGQFEADVPLEWTRAYFDKHLPAVFSTPAMIGMMEAASARAIAPMLPAGTLTVGTRIEVDHLKAVGIGSHVITTARLAEINGRFLTFEVEAHSNGVLIGRGRIFHAIVDHERFARIATGDASAPGT
jgi:fluoroacetyl-CoA thioesterase